MSEYSNYESGGKGFTSPNKAIENATYREFMSQAGGKEGLASKELPDVVNILNSILDQLTRNTELSNEQTNEMKSAMRDAVMSSANTQQGAKAGTGILNNLIGSNTELLKGLSQQKGLTGQERSVLNSTNNSALKQLVMLNQGILNTLKQMSVNMEKSANASFRFTTDFDEANASNEKKEDQRQAEQIEQFGLLKQIIAYGLNSSPTANKLRQLGSAWIGKQLFKVMGDPNQKEGVRKAAALAVYFQIPQTLMSIISMIFTQVLSNAIMKLTGKMFTGFMSTVKSGWGPLTNLMRVGWTGVVGAFTNLATTLGISVGALGGIVLLAVGAVAAIVAGVMAHKKKMKENDAKIDADPRMSQKEKDVAKLKAHTASGAKAGIAGGALGGAAIGAVVGSVIPGIGTAIGAVVGGLVGLIGGPIIGALTGAIKPLINIWKNHKDAIISKIAPITKVLGAIFMMCNPFFALVTLAMRAIMKLPLIKNLFGGDKDNNGGGNDGTPSWTDTILHPIATKKDKELQKQLGNDYVGMRYIGLKGQVAKENSVPFIRKDNVSNVRFLDQFLTSRGYNVKYTSAMGGDHAGGPRSHASGNKLDFVLERNGKKVQMSPQEFSILKAMGFFGNGAVGYHNAGSGYHYDTHVGQYVKLNSTAEGQKWLAQEAERVAQQKKEQEKKKTEDSLKNKQTYISAPKKRDPSDAVMYSASPKKKDVTGTKDYTDMQNTTNNLVNRGSY